MSLLPSSTTTRRWRLRQPNGLPPATVPTKSVKLYGAASAYNSTGPVLNPIATYTPAYDAATGVLSWTQPATDIASEGLYREVGAAVDGASNSYALDRPVLVRQPVRPRWTRWELRHFVADLLDDLRTGSAESVGADAKSLTDSDRWEEEWQGEWLYCYAGSAAGQERRVSAYNSTTGQLSWVRAMSPVPAIGDLYELHHRFQVAQYNRMLNLAITQVAEAAGLQVVDDTVLQTSTTALEYGAPAGFALVNGLWTRDVADATADWAEGDLDADVTVLPGARLLRFASAAKGQRVRVQGVLLPGPLDDDLDVPDLDAGFLIFKAAAHLSSSQIQQAGLDRDADAQRATLFHQQAEALRPTLPPPPNAVRLI